MGLLCLVICLHLLLLLLLLLLLQRVLKRLVGDAIDIVVLELLVFLVEGLAIGSCCDSIDALDVILRKGHCAIVLTSLDCDVLEQRHEHPHLVLWLLLLLVLLGATCAEQLDAN